MDEIREEDLPSTHAPGLGPRQGRRAAEGWTDYQIAIILGVQAPTFGRWRSGLRYPDVRMLKKMEAVFGWPAAEQIDLIPLSGYDLRWSMKFTPILNEWKMANPRTVSVKELRALHPIRSGRPRSGP
jgi:transcriptional regulator with XRE-family HTH domain